ncbi:uncharacterized protein LOC109597572 [Aethina tumida]|uniref:uncharacterized protein LOC109597572 n=1 Tax=Aethina tumida TaxID=116153 RepID=UPI00096B61EE|nr:uncharacterized protein LOC109597572 [Aethina tumida]
MFAAFWPATACLTIFFIVGVIMIMLRYGPRICGLRHTAFTDDDDWEHKTYEQTVSYA